MIRNDVRRLTQAQAEAILFPGHAGSPEEAAGVPPLQRWVAWSPPDPALPVDAEISALITAGAIGTPAEALARQIACPYYTARQYIALGAARATRQFAAVRQRQKDLGPKAETVAKQAARLVDLAERLLTHERDVADILATGTSRMGEWHDVEQIQEDHRALQATFMALRAVTPQLTDAAKRLDARNKRITPQNATGDPWKLTFIFKLDQLAQVLTQHPLCEGAGLSYKFIQSAYASLGGGTTVPNDWISAVRTVRQRIGRLPAWEQDGRATGQFAPEEIERAATATAFTFSTNEAVARKVVADALAGKPNSGWIATRYYGQASVQMRRLMDALGWTAERRTEHPDPAI